MKYNIISINDDRAEYKKVIRERVRGDEVIIPAVNAYEVDVDEELKKRDLFVRHDNMFSTGELGIWLSMFDRWQWAVENNEELITFEDDAIPATNFNEWFYDYKKELPKTYDFLCLWVPENQYLDYVYDVVYDDEGRPETAGPNKNVVTSNYNYGAMRLARAYNGYGNVAQMFSPKGAQFFIDRVRAVGIYTPVDCYQYQEAHAGRCEGYSPKPRFAKAVSYDWAAETTIHIGKEN